ncbi:MAG: hypothetical protein IPN76_32435 [Saprospiraceae bacterium]|nr:hypothetical protein [Saprospiraceae bacterium]
MPTLEATTSLSLPEFDNGTAPPIFPAPPIPPVVSNVVLVPYFMVNDKTMPNWGDRITQRFLAMSEVLVLIPKA